MKLGFVYLTFTLAVMLSLGACSPGSSDSPSPGPSLAKAGLDPAILDQYPCPEIVPVVEPAPPEPEPVVTEPVAGLKSASVQPNVLICHIPPGSPIDRQELCISRAAVMTHISERGPNQINDYLGSCF